MSPPPKVFVIGGTGAQGIPIISSLVHDKAYTVRALTRDPTSPRAQHLLSLNNVELHPGTFASETSLRTGLHGCDLAFVNIDGFNAGEKTEMFWAMRAYELAIEEGVKFFVFGNLDYVYKKGGYDARFRTGHYDGKGRVGEWILGQNKGGKGSGSGKGGRMGAALFTTGPYVDVGTPMAPTVEDDVVIWRVPLGDGAVPHVSLEDCGYYVRWLFDHQDEANGMDLEVAIEHVNYHDMARAFTAVTGQPARYEDVDLETFWEGKGMANLPTGYNADPNDPATLSIRENFTGFWNAFKHSGGNQGVLRRDYDLLDRIHPKRIRTVEEWFRREDERRRKAGEGGLFRGVESFTSVLKITDDGRKGVI